MATPLTAARIVDSARDIHARWPQTTIGMHSPPNALRSALETLAQSAGLSATLLHKTTTADLISVYLVALKDGEAAKRTAQKIGFRLDDTLLGTPEPVLKKGEPMHPPTVDMGVVRALIKTEVRDGALEPLQAALDTFAAETEGRLQTLRVSTEELYNRFADADRDLQSLAHAAAVEALKSLTPTRLEVVIGCEPVVPLGLVHRDTAKIINALSAGVNVYLHGPAGSGKTTVARKCAEAFSLQFYFAAKVESEYQLIGFKDAKGDTVRTQFREAYEHGGVFLFDEMDASSPAAVVALNAALANGVCPFPDGIVQRHASFYAIGAGNTKLTGANRQYAGRNQLDAASIDRFAFIEFGYDDELEMALASDHKWARYVQAVRAAVAERGLNHLVTPRATYDGCRLLANGFDWDTVATMCVFKGLEADTVRQIVQAIPKGA